MNDSSNIPPKPDDENIDKPETQSQGTMVFTMLLLIAGFLFASILLMKQTLETRTAEGEPVFQPSKLIDKGKSLISRPATVNATATTNTPAKQVRKEHSSTLENIKQIVTFQTGDKVRWPRLKLTGFGKSTDDSEGFAIINGDQVHPGEYIRKVKLLEVRTHDVIVEYKGERKTLTVDLEN